MTQRIDQDVTLHIGHDGALLIDADRRRKFEAIGLSTGVYVRARDTEDAWHSADIAWLDRPSVSRWLTSRGGSNPWAENLVLLLLGHEPAPAETPNAQGMTKTGHLFHTLLPIPECCGSQMKLAGNLSLHRLRYDCPLCLQSLEVEAIFWPHAAVKPMPPDVRDDVDRQE